VSEPLPEVRYKFHPRRREGRIVLAETPPGEQAPAPVPRVSRLLALAYKSQRMINDGTIESMADVARLGHVTRARVTQILDLLLLAPDLQETLLFLPPSPGRDPIHLRELRYVCQTPLWSEQRKRWLELGVASGEAS
jgi:hypothetical protein